MPDGPRVLVAAALGKIIEPFLRQSMNDATVRIAEDRAAVERAVSDRLRFDVVVAQPEVVGIYRKATGPQLLVEAVDIAVRGGNLTGSQFSPDDSPPDIPRIHTYFSRGKGATAARLAGAIASGRAVNHETLASSAHVGYDTAAKLVD